MHQLNGQIDNLLPLWTLLKRQDEPGTVTPAVLGMSIDTTAALGFLIQTLLI